MRRFLVRRRGTTMDYVVVPKHKKLIKTDNGYKLVRGVVHTGMTLIVATTAVSAMRKLLE